MGSRFPKSFSVVTVTGYGADTVNKAGGKMTRLLFWQDQSSNASCSFAFAKSEEARASEPTFPDAPKVKDPPPHSLGTGQSGVTIAAFHVNLLSLGSWDTSLFDWGVWYEECVSVSSVALRAGPQCMCRSQHCLNTGPRTDMIFEKRPSALAFSAPPKVTAEIERHTPVLCRTTEELFAALDQ